MKITLDLWSLCAILYLTKGHTARQRKGDENDIYSLFFEECVTDGIEREVRALIKGDKDALSRYALAPNSWGIPSDHHKCRRLIVENNQDIIGSTYIQSLEEELARARDSLRWYREKDGLY